MHLISLSFTDVQASMYRLASDFAFPRIVTKRRLHPQIFAAKSTKDSAWVAPFRQDILQRYKRINEAIAKYVAYSSSIFVLLLISLHIVVMPVYYEK